MHTQDAVGKTALYFNPEYVPYCTRVMVTKFLRDNTFIVSDYEDPYKTYETIGWYFTVEKAEDQPLEPELNRFLKAYEERASW